MKNFILFVTLIAILIGCKEEKSEYQLLRDIYKKPTHLWPKPDIDSTVEHRELAIIPDAKYPNGKQPSRGLIELGKQLFFDHRLSQSKQLACASCHHPDQNFTDNRQVSMGNLLQQGKRNAPTLLNLSHNTSFFWDGRAASLEEQVLGPLQNPIEMNTSLDTVVARVNNIKGYRKAFKKELSKDKIDINDIAYVIASFERSLVSNKSKFDFFLHGDKELTESELKGLHLFRTKGRCMNCHNGPHFTDHKFHNIGLSYYGRYYEDLGRYNVTKKKEDVGAFRTPSLRDVMRTRPWMHNGLFDDMDGILNMYSNGMPQPKRKEHQLNDSLFPSTSRLIVKTNFTEEDKKNIIAFLHTISAPSVWILKPELPKE
ncbi:cytochrome-c peroxidase [Tenacibaculum sp. M341]|uniref:cytochrome-c peroxidase n=1 Tax=Tenacibaculum sp. M341 TaxID=2530339 RepID=UPI001404AB18|nr:cytochrome c peroxidase [Tenacibaculum sp. M341]